MLLTLRITLAIIVVVLSVYSLITENYDFSSYTILFLGFMILVMGLDELQKDRKNFWGYTSIIISLFIFLSLY
ncbi:DUF3953 domain-containing protein [Bacillus sp. FJAT-27986]|uniref:DUF3953 domain-containing protein n=1 Tax=Bacillus sp. FJAT-27986 TaxID=1743146 RepID=UPI00080AF6DE|nr:DUF3953 domain-containing protein [Bacillus sp. FJAT-27986]OCA81725.1 hypothetical protein A8L44_14045 [Bacillus sp. FJAT-27986]